MILHIYLGAFYLPDTKLQSWSSGFFFLSFWHNNPPNLIMTQNGTLYVDFQVIHTIISSNIQT